MGQVKTDFNLNRLGTTDFRGPARLFRVIRRVNDPVRVHAELCSSEQSNAGAWEDGHTQATSRVRPQAWHRHTFWGRSRSMARMRWTPVLGVRWRRPDRHSVHSMGLLQLVDSQADRDALRCVASCPESWLSCEWTDTQVLMAQVWGAWRMPGSKVAFLRKPVVGIGENGRLDLPQPVSMPGVSTGLTKRGVAGGPRGAGSVGRGNCDRQTGARRPPRLSGVWLRTDAHAHYGHEGAVRVSQG